MTVSELPVHGGTDVAPLLAELARRGLTVSADGTDLRLLGPREQMDAELVARIRAGKPDLIRALSPGAPATLLQRSYLLGRTGTLADDAATSPASHVYHEFDGHWEVPRLQRALDAVVARHEALRTRFTSSGGRILEPAARAVIETIDLRALSAGDRDARLARERTERAHRVLPVDVAPLLAVAVTLLDERRMRLHVGHDGLAIDGISMLLFFEQWWTAYTADARADADPDDPGYPAFDDYVAARERAGAAAPAARSRAAWLERVDTLPPPPDLPAQAGADDHRFTRHEVRIDPPRWARLTERAAAEGVTQAAMLLAAWAETLSYWGAGREMTITTTLADRPPIHPGMHRSVGQYSDVLLVPLELDPDADLRTRVHGVQARLRRGLSDRHFSGLEVLRERQRRGRSARMPYTFNCALGHPGASGAGIAAFGEQVYGVSQTPQVWLNVFVMEAEGELRVQLDAVEAVFPVGLVAAVAEGYAILLDRLLDDTTWSARTVDLMPADQRARRATTNATTVAVPPRRAHEEFLAVAATTPDAPAVLTEGRVVGYGELARRAVALAHRLRERGVGRDELVGLVMRRGPEQLVGIMAAAIAGAAYLPIDADLPPARRAYLLRDGEVRCVLANVDVPSGPDGVEVLQVDLDAPDPGPAEPPEPLPGSTVDDLLYVLYTSGTTGAPKGVMISHRSVVNLVADCGPRFGITAADRFFGISAFNFDLSVFDVFGALSSGAAVVLPEHDRATDADHWLRLCARFGVSVWNSVPAIVGVLAQEAATDPSALAALRLVMMSGDRIPPALPVALHALLPHTAVVALGGPTETTVWNILHPITDPGDGHSPVPYGRPNANNRCYVLDDTGRERPDGVVGEICAAGTGLARGYWRAPERTADRFSSHEGLRERIYRTGDLGYVRPDGEIAITGRKDFQIKINGYRIEAAEVETRLSAIDEVRHAVVVRQDSAVGARLVAHLVLDEPAPDDAAIRERLRTQLPEYMVPSVLVRHTELPLTGNGKVDRGALGAVAAEAEPAATDVRPGSGLEAELAALWADVLGRRVPDVTTGFFDLGGDSLAAARVLTAVRRRWGTAILLDDFYLFATVRELAARVGSGS